MFRLRYLVGKSNRGREADTCQRLSRSVLICPVVTTAFRLIFGLLDGADSNEVRDDGLSDTGIDEQRYDETVLGKERSLAGRLVQLGTGGWKAGDPRQKGDLW